MAHPQIRDGEIRIVGHRWSRQAHELKAFLARSRVGYRWLDVERDREAAGYLGDTRDGRETLPIVILPDGTRLVRPAVRDLAERIGLDTEPDQPFYDLLIVGGGPAGLSAAVYAASEGIRTIVVEQEVPGGQAGYSAKIENYPGFPEGLSGRDFAQRTVAQAERFGVEILSTRHVESLAVKGRYREICLDDEKTVAAHAVLLATGVAFRWLEAPGCPDLVGRGVYYGAAVAEASDCRDQRLYVLGGGNSAGQAAVLLAEYARRVTIVAPEPSLEDTMSQYLLERIGELPNIETCPGHTVVGAEGRKHLERLVLQRTDESDRRTVAADGLFVFIGAEPRTQWLEGVVDRDEQGFILADERMETSVPGVFVAGDARAGSVKRIASAVGEGAMAVQFIHGYLADR
ncbi:MAG TPA: FAD-dependent oxidoreductase [Gemmatimonadales bacterium]|nr:FAD-dependent oxidoreductase [Gemmatimonadales bacterium]